jgi:hypothetical protein
VNKPVKPPRIDADQFRAYGGTGLDLIPLNMPLATKRGKDGKSRKIGKAPRDKLWVTRAYERDQVVALCIRDNRNMGTRLRRDDLVIDVDPRNGGNESLAKLAEMLKLNIKSPPHVVTGADGLHLFGKKPPKLKINTKLADFPGLEFKTYGSQVVCGGSLHPETLNHYTMTIFDPPDSAVRWPRNLLELVARKPREAGSGHDEVFYQPKDLAKMLAAIPYSAVAEYPDWLKLMMACHAATDGNGVDVFVDWNAKTPDHPDCEDLIREKWDGFTTDRASGDSITVGTLHKFLTDAGAAGLIPRISAEDDFEEGLDAQWLQTGTELDDEDEETFDFEGTMPKTGADNEMLTELNDKYCAVTTGGKYRIMYQARNAKGPDWEWTSKTDFLSLHENRKIFSADNPDKTVPLGLSWQQWPRRRTASGTTFDASLEAGALDANNNLNLWLGWAIEPQPGKWTRFEAMIRDDICSGESKAAEYFFNWAAWKFQHPGELPGTAFAMRGNKGTGKGTLGEAFVNIFGNHAIATSSMDHVFGRFNGHMERILFAFADEAFWAGDPRQDARLKKLVTDRDSMFEHKNIQPYPGINRTAVMLATNDDWVVPATEGERRYCVVRTSDKHQCPEGEPNHPNRPYWNAIYAELRSGGLAAFLHAMLHRPLAAGWHPRAHVPLTQELAEQKARSLKGVVGFYFERLQTGTVTETLEGTSQDWNGGDLRVSPTEFWEACRDWIHMTNPRATVTRRGVSNELKRFGWDIGDHLKHGKACHRYWLCPALDTARAKFNEALKGKMFD